MIEKNLIKKLGFLPLLVFAGGFAFLVFSLYSHYIKSDIESGPTHQSRALTFKLREEAIKKAQTEGRSDYHFEVKGSFPFYSPFEGVNVDEIKQSG